MAFMNRFEELSLLRDTSHDILFYSALELYTDCSIRSMQTVDMKSEVYYLKSFSPINYDLSLLSEIRDHT